MGRVPGSERTVFSDPDIFVVIPLGVIGYLMKTTGFKPGTHRHGVAVP